MNLQELKKIQKHPYLSDFSVYQLITELSLYEPVLITPKAVEFIQALYDGEIPFVRVSKETLYLMYGTILRWLDLRLCHIAVLARDI